LKVIVFDPAYTSLLKGNTKASASNVFDMGAVLSTITEACLAEGATPVFAHHTVKNAGKQTGRNGATYKTYEPAELGDLAFAGFGEFARQWLLLARRAEYEPGTGKHQLWLTTGGSAGFNGCYAVDEDWRIDVLIDRSRGDAAGSRCRCPCRTVEWYTLGN